jgi:hypothetical protein
MIISYIFNIVVSFASGKLYSNIGMQSFFSDLPGLRQSRKCCLNQTGISINFSWSSFKLVNVSTNLSHFSCFSDNIPVAAITDPAVEFSLTHVEEEHIDQFMSSLQVIFLCMK